MTPKDIVVFVEEESGRTGRLAFAVALAARWGAHVIATFVADRIELTPCKAFARGGGLAAMLRRHRGDVVASAARTRASFEELCGRAGVSGEWRFAEDEAGEPLMLHARHAGLAIVGPPDRPAGPPRTLGLSEGVIFESGRPTLLLPLDWPTDRIARRVVVGWNGSREATSAVAGAMPFLAAAEAVHLVVVPEARLCGTLGADPGADLSRHLVRHGVPVVLEQCAGRDAGRVLLDRTRTLGADLLVMGAYGRSRLRERVFGGATRTVLGAADVPILLSR
ncbi:universal stress protein [Azospirillum sp. ST 5-10]|uniref:universal stress protein n=1 Tax=unclassified Azospirillum TaxID=2630922 RepID=UPI003F49D56C